MCTKSQPFAGKHLGGSAITIHVLSGNRPAMKEGLETTLPALYNLITRCWAGDPALRPTASEAFRRLDEDVRTQAEQGLQLREADLARPSPQGGNARRFNPRSVSTKGRFRGRFASES